MNRPVVAAPLFALVLSLVAGNAPRLSAADKPHPWPPDAFLPVTAERSAALPAAEQPAWRAYLDASTKRAQLMPGRDLVDHSSTKRLDGPPIPSSYSRGVNLRAAAAWYATEPARQIADHVVAWQTPVGGWTKSGDYSRARQPADDHKDAWSFGTFDNDSTLNELRYLARVITAAGDDPRARPWRACFLRGLDYVLAAQYPNGGFPQIYPLVGGYHDAITFNDDAMLHALQLMCDLRDNRPEFAFVPAELRVEAGRRFDRGVACVLAAQIRAPDGRRSIWGAQHDALTLAPCAARNFEPVAECALESAHLLEFLMALSNPSPAVIVAVEAGMAWYPVHAVRGVVWNRDATEGTGLVERPGAPDLWARFYELGTGKPVFGERDRMVHYVVTELTNERRKGYGWYGTWPAAALAEYPVWRAKHVAAR